MTSMAQLTCARRTFTSGGRSNSVGAKKLWESLQHAGKADAVDDEAKALELAHQTR